MNDRIIHDTRVKYGKDKSLAEIWDKTAEVIIRFLNLPDRTVVRGKWLKTAYLEVNERGQWVDIFNNFRRNNTKLHQPGTGLLDVVFSRFIPPSERIDKPRDYQLEKEITEAFAEYSTNLEWDEWLYTIVVTKRSKQIKVEWAYNVNEVYFDFFENDTKIYKDWADFFAGETTSEIFNYVKFLVNRFINLPSRVITQGKWLKTTNLEVCENGKWEDIYENISLT
jgi:hypothetical protein